MEEMTGLPASVLAEGLVPEVRRSRWETLFLVATGMLASTILLKVASIQYLELLYLLQIGLLLAAFCARGFQVTWYRPFLRIGVFWAVFAAAAVALGVASLRLPFYLPSDLTPLKRPVVITGVRVVELAANVCVMLYLADRLRQNARKARLLMQVYFWTGVASAAYSAVSYPLDLLGIGHYGSYSDLHRWRGFYNEGGPYGLYVVSVLLVGFALYRLRWARARALKLSLVLLVPALVLAYSKAAVLACLLLVAVNTLLASSLRRRLVILTAGVAVLAMFLMVFPVAEAVRVYQRSSANYELASHLHSKDGNFVAGRVAGTFIVPRMLAAHPLAGVGWGNYGILRNAPEFRGASAWVDINDDPGLGMVGYAPELGLPLLVYGLVCLVLPFLYLQRIGAPGYLQNLALFQPIVHLAGAQFNLSYPWVVTCLALGVASWQARKRGEVSRDGGVGGIL